MVQSRLAFPLALALACAAPPPPPDPEAQLLAARADLAAAGFSFEADVAFRADPYVVCDGLACAELQVRAGRRTVLLAREAWDSPARLRASLLDIWDRYRRPRAPDHRDRARSALRILEHGPAAGIDDVLFLRRVYHRYGQLFERLPESASGELPKPRDLVYP